jgi:hypothetical protein
LKQEEKRKEKRSRKQKVEDGGRAGQVGATEGWRACSHLAMQGATAKAIQEPAGHQDLATTQRYMHLSPAHKGAAIRLLDRRPMEDGSPLDSAPPIGAARAALRSGQAVEETVGDSLETNLRPEPESSCSK